MQHFLQNFMDETSSDGAVAAMADFQSEWRKALEMGRQAKIHLTEVFMLKGAKMCADGKASDCIQTLTHGKQLLSKQLSLLKSKGLEINEQSICPWLIKESRRLLEDKPTAAGDIQ